MRRVPTENATVLTPYGFPSSHQNGTRPPLQGTGRLSRGRASPLPEGEGTLAHRVKQGRTDRRQYDNVHRAILTGLLSSVSLRGDGYEYTVAGGGKGHIWPGSGVFAQRLKWLVAAEVVETTRRYLRTCGRIEPGWIEPIARARPSCGRITAFIWPRAQASAMALERVTLMGLTIVAGRRIDYGPIDPTTSRHLMIEEGLVGGHIEPKPAFLVENEELVESWTGSRRSCGAATCWRATLPATSSTTAACRPRSMTALPWRNGCGPIRTRSR